MAIGFRDGPESNLSYLSAAAYDNDAFAVDLLKRLNLCDGTNNVKRCEVVDENIGRVGQIEFKVDARFDRLVFNDGYGTNVAAMPRNDSTQLVKYPRSVHGLKNQAYSFSFAQSATSYFLRISSQHPRAFSSVSITSRIAPEPPEAAVTAVADRFTS